ncbi:uncharacterized protein LOC125488668, partial [Plutella xylostella]|uniref:uncharacterized protein LOC125488668 n=1 Tax=Plutella xylostella TaxID=51655 RepID=UPI00203282E6
NAEKTIDLIIINPLNANGTYLVSLVSTTQYCVVNIQLVKNLTSPVFAVRLIRSEISGKIQAVYQGYTYYCNYRAIKSSRWSCTKYPKCKASLVIGMKMNIIKGKTFHNHELKSTLPKILTAKSFHDELFGL